MQILKYLKLSYLDMVEMGKSGKFWVGFCVKGQTGKKKHCAESSHQYCKFSIINTRAGFIMWQVFGWGRLCLQWGKTTEILASYLLALVLFSTPSLAFLSAFCQCVRWSAMRGAQFVWEGCQCNSLWLHNSNVSSSNVCTILNGSTVNQRQLDLQMQIYRILFNLQFWCTQVMLICWQTKSMLESRMIV